MNVWDLTPLFKNEKELEISALSLQNECEKFEAKYSDKFLNLSDEGIVVMGMLCVAFALYRLRFRQIRLAERVQALKEQLED